MLTYSGIAAPIELEELNPYEMAWPDTSKARNTPPARDEVSTSCEKVPRIQYSVNWIQ